MLSPGALRFLRAQGPQLDCSQCFDVPCIFRVKLGGHLSDGKVSCVTFPLRYGSAGFPCSAFRVAVRKPTSSICKSDEDLPVTLHSLPVDLAGFIQRNQEKPPARSRPASTGRNAPGLAHEIADFAAFPSSGSNSSSEGGAAGPGPARTLFYVLPRAERADLATRNRRSVQISSVP